MAITPLPTAPSRSDPEEIFDERADTWVAALPPWTDEVNALAFDVDADATSAASDAAAAASSAASALAAPGTNATSSTSVAIGLGSKSFTIQTGKDFVVGMVMIVADDAAPTTNTMVGGVTSYNPGTGSLVIDVSNTSGSGTKSAWTISISGRAGLDGGSNIVLDTSPQLGGSLDPNGNYVGSARGANIPSATSLVIGTDGDYFTVTGSTTISTIIIAAHRLVTLVFSSTLTLVDSATITLPENQNFTTSPGDHITFQSPGTANNVFTTSVSKTDGSSPNGADLVSTNNLSDVSSPSASLSNVGGIGSATTNTLTNKTINANGTGNVLTNIDVNNCIAASQSEAESGTDNTKILTPLRVAQAISAQSSGGAWNLIGTSVASSSPSLTVTGLDSTYDTYAISVSDIVASNDVRNLWLRVGDSGGIDSGTTDYSYHVGIQSVASPAYAAFASGGATFMVLSTSAGNAAGEGTNAMLFLTRPQDGAVIPIITGTTSYVGNAGEHIGGNFAGYRNAVISLDRIQILMNSGNIATGRLTVWGIAHE